MKNISKLKEGIARIHHENEYHFMDVVIENEGFFTKENSEKASAKVDCLAHAVRRLLDELEMFDNVTISFNRK